MEIANVCKNVENKTLRCQSQCFGLRKLKELIYSTVYKQSRYFNSHGIVLLGWKTNLLMENKLVCLFIKRHIFCPLLRLPGHPVVPILDLVLAERLSLVCVPLLVAPLRVAAAATATACRILAAIATVL